MTTQTVKLIDRSRSVLAVANVADEGDHFGGTIDLRGSPANLRALLDEFEEIVNGQMFSFLDEIEEKIAAVPVKAVFENGQEVDIKDLQIFPSTGDVSFKLAGGPPMLSEAKRKEIERRVAEDDASPNDVIPWEEVKAQTLSRLPDKA